MTQQELEKHVSAAMDSVNLITETLLEWPPMGDPMPSDVSATVARNTEHLTLMMTKDWFVQALSPEQAAAINEIVG